MADLEKGRESLLHEDKGARQDVALWACDLPVTGLRAGVGDPHMTLIMKDRGSGHVHHIGRVEHQCTRSPRKNILNLKHRPRIWDLILKASSSQDVVPGCSHPVTY